MTKSYTRSFVFEIRVVEVGSNCKVFVIIKSVEGMNCKSYKIAVCRRSILFPFTVFKINCILSLGCIILGILKEISVGLNLTVNRCNISVKGYRVILVYEVACSGINRAIVYAEGI